MRKIYASFVAVPDKGLAGFGGCIVEVEKFPLDEDDIVMLHENIRAITRQDHVYVLGWQIVAQGEKSRHVADLFFMSGQGDEN
jgi:hypothetical protein